MVPLPHVVARLDGPLRLARPVLSGDGHARRLGVHQQLHHFLYGGWPARRTSERICMYVYHALTWLARYRRVDFVLGVTTTFVFGNNDGGDF